MRLAHFLALILGAILAALVSPLGARRARAEAPLLPTLRAALLHKHIGPDGKPRKVQPPGTDAFGDPLPAGALARVGTARLRHSERIRSLVVSADGSTLASGTNTFEHSFHVW